MTARTYWHYTCAHSHEVIGDAGHVPWLEQPEAFRAAVERILSSA